MIQSIRNSCAGLLLFVLGSIFADLTVQAEEGQVAAASSASSSAPYVKLSRDSNGWVIGPFANPNHGPRYHAEIYIDDSLVRQNSPEAFHVGRLSRGVHKVTVAFDVAGTPQGQPGQSYSEKLVILETGTLSQTSITSEPRVFNFPIAVGDKKIAAVNVQVTQGDLVELRWSSDAAVDIHLHGYDIEGSVEPGASLAMVFDASIAGRFSVETHQKSGHRTLAFIDVYPR